MMQMSTRSSSVSIDWVLPLGVNIHETIKATILSFSFRPPIEKFLSLDWGFLR